MTSANKPISRAGNVGLWKHFGKNENLLYGTTDFYEICGGDWNRCHIGCVKFLFHSCRSVVVISRFLRGGALFVDTLHMNFIEDTERLYIMLHMPKNLKVTCR